MKNMNVVTTNDLCGLRSPEPEVNYQTTLDWSPDPDLISTSAMVSGVKWMHPGWYGCVCAALAPYHLTPGACHSVHIRTCVCWSVLLQPVPTVHVQHQVHALRALTCYSSIKALTSKHENNSTGRDNVGFCFFLDWDSVINNISDYRVNWFLANAKCWSINNDRTHERVKSQHSLAVHWLWSGTVTAQTPLRFHTLLQMFWCFLISEAVLCLWTEDTQISVMEAELEETSLPSSVVSLSGSILTTGEVRWTVRVRTGCFVFVTITAASSARWLTVYIPAAVVC